MSCSHRLRSRRVRACLLSALTFAAWSAAAAQTVAGPLLQYDRPAGFARGSDGEAETWIADSLDGVVHVYPFRQFRGDFQTEFRRTLFHDRILPLYREDRRLAEPAFTPRTVKGADAAITASFKNFNGGVPREHVRVAILAGGFVALVDVSANSPRAFERNWPSVSRLLSSLRVNASGVERPSEP